MKTEGLNFKRGNINRLAWKKETYFRGLDPSLRKRLKLEFIDNFIPRKYHSHPNSKHEKEIIQFEASKPLAKEIITKTKRSKHDLYQMC